MANDRAMPGTRSSTSWIRSLRLFPRLAASACGVSSFLPCRAPSTSCLGPTTPSQSFRHSESGQACSGEVVDLQLKASLVLHHAIVLEIPCKRFIHSGDCRILLVLVSIVLRAGMLASENPTLELAGPLHRDKTVDPRPWLCFKRHIAVDVGVPATRTQAEFSGAQLPQARVDPFECGELLATLPANPRQSWLEGRFELAVHPKVTSAPLGLQAIYLRTAKGVEPLGWLCENRAEHLCNVGLGSSLGLYPGTVKSRHTRLFSAFRNCSRPA